MRVTAECCTVKFSRRPSPFRKARPETGEICRNCGNSPWFFAVAPEPERDGQLGSSHEEIWLRLGLKMLEAISTPMLIGILIGLMLVAF
jgi:hypothetical protein